MPTNEQDIDPIQIMQRQADLTSHRSGKRIKPFFSEGDQGSVGWHLRSSFPADHPELNQILTDHNRNLEEVRRQWGSNEARLKAEEGKIVALAEKRYAEKEDQILRAINAPASTETYKVCPLRDNSGAVYYSLEPRFETKHELTEAIQNANTELKRIQLAKLQKEPGAEPYESLAMAEATSLVNLGGELHSIEFSHLQKQTNFGKDDEYQSFKKSYEAAFAKTTLRQNTEKNSSGKRADYPIFEDYADKEAMGRVMESLESSSEDHFDERGAKINHGKLMVGSGRVDRKAVAARLETLKIVRRNGRRIDSPSSVENPHNNGSPDVDPKKYESVLDELSSLTEDDLLSPVKNTRNNGSPYMSREEERSSKRDSQYAQKLREQVTDIYRSAEVSKNKIDIESMPIGKHYFGGTASGGKFESGESAVTFQYKGEDVRIHVKSVWPNRSQVTVNCKNEQLAELIKGSIEGRSFHDTIQTLSGSAAVNGYHIAPPDIHTDETIVNNHFYPEALEATLDKLIAKQQIRQQNQELDTRIDKYEEMRKRLDRELPGEQNHLYTDISNGKYELKGETQKAVLVGNPLRHGFVAQPTHFVGISKYADSSGREQTVRINISLGSHFYNEENKLSIDVDCKDPRLAEQIKQGLSNSVSTKEDKKRLLGRLAIAGSSGNLADEIERLSKVRFQQKSLSNEFAPNVSHDTINTPQHRPLSPPPYSQSSHHSPGAGIGRPPVTSIANRVITSISRIPREINGNRVEGHSSNLGSSQESSEEIGGVERSSRRSILTRIMSFIKRRLLGDRQNDHSLDRYPPSSSHSYSEFDHHLSEKEKVDAISPRASSSITERDLFEDARRINQNVPGQVNGKKPKVDSMIHEGRDVDLDHMRFQMLHDPARRDDHGNGYVFVTAGKKSAEEARMDLEPDQDRSSSRHPTARFIMRVVKESLKMLAGCVLGETYESSNKRGQMERPRLVKTRGLSNSEGQNRSRGR